MPLIHFSGNFKYQLAYFNNEPKNDARKPGSYDLQLNDENLKVKFDSSLSPDEIHQRLLCDPTKYFEFEFSEVYVKRITYDDGSSMIKTEYKIPLLANVLCLNVCWSMFHRI